MKKGDTVRFKNLYGFWIPVVVVQPDIGFGHTLVCHFPPQDSEEAEFRSTEPFAKQTSCLELNRRGFWAKPELHKFIAQNQAPNLGSSPGCGIAWHFPQQIRGGLDSGEHMHWGEP